ncbi:hypothetical protein HMPREF0737_01017 [Rothia mucilaginosa M508]|uniref:Uncharacterized protein n=2 Tax=Rothia TaxID=32207 RepID=G5ERV7_9MICC|nr:hypothetical protein [Rothia mucilaginosa]EHB87894.1 hypothetical protein HMPREF0737_01017 [Rothia mucilaginosa M508]
MPNPVPESVHPAAPAWSAEYLQEFLWRIVPGRSMRSMDDEVIAEFFREHPEHWEKIWALFTVEGAMPSNGLALWFIYDAQLTICGHDLLVYLAEHFPQYRARIEQECVQALLRDYAPQNARVFSRSFEALTAVPKGLRGAERKQALAAQAQSYARHGALIPALLASPVATTATVGAQMLQSVLQVCAPSGGSAPAGQVPLTAGELQALVAEALPAAAQLLFRREKKLMTAGLKVLELSVRVVPERTGEVSAYAQDAVEVLPLELRDRAQKLCPDTAPAQPSSIQPGSAQPASTQPATDQPPCSVQIPDVPALGLSASEVNAALNAAPQAGRASEATRDAIRNDRDCEELLFALYHLNEREQSVRRIPALLSYLHRAHQEGRIIEFSPAFQKHLRRYLSRTWHDVCDQLRYLAYRLLVQHVHAADPDPQAALTEHTGRFQGADFHFKGYPRKGSEYWAYRSPTALFHEQLRVAFGDQPYSSEGAAGQGFAPLLAEPLPAVERSFERTVIRLKSYREALPKVLHGEYEVNDSTYELWQVPGEEPATEWSTFTAAAYAVAGACAEYPGRSLEHTEVPSVALVCGWYAWAMRHNPDLLAAQYKPLLSVYQFSRLHGFEEVMQTLGAAERALGVPSYNFLAWASVASAKNPEYRLAAAEAIAALFEAGLLDVSTFAETLKWALEDGMVLPNRLVATLREVSAISPLAGWRVLQVLRLLLPMVGELTKGGDYVRLAVELAELYGTPVEIPVELEPKMKGSTVLAKSLRALAAVTPRVTEEALAAREAALALLGES